MLVVGGGGVVQRARVCDGLRLLMVSKRLLRLEIMRLGMRVVAGGREVGRGGGSGK